VPEHQPQHETRLDHEQQESGGGLHYQRSFRDPDQARKGVTPAGVAENVGTPDQQQQGQEYGGPNADEEAVLRQHGYPKLGSSIPSRVTQVEHGPYAGGTQQGTHDTRTDSKDRPVRAPEGADNAAHSE
jgi:hypothetical protein